MPENLGKPAFLADRAADFIRRHRHERFALYVNFLEPHMPFFGPRDDQYDPADMPLPESFADLPGQDEPLKARLMVEFYRRRGHSGLPLETEAHWRRMIANYWGLCSLVDTHVGTILATLDACGLEDNTIVVFTSDHGDMMGAHRLIAKSTMFQEAVRVPMMIRLPGQTDGRRVGGPVSQIDMVPTLLELLGQEVPDHLEGRSLRGEIESAADRVERDVFIEWYGPNPAINGVSRDTPVADWMAEMAGADRCREAIADPVRTIVSADGWKLNCSPLGEHGLYDLNTDPFERRNVFGERRDIARRLRERIVAWQQSMGDTVDLPEF